METDPPPDAHEQSLIRRLLDRLGLSRAPDTTEDLEQEIQELLEEGEEQGLITRQEGRMINSIFEFRDTLAYEIMTPRSEMVTAAATIAVGDLIRLIIDRGFTRIPVYGETADHIVGIVHAKDLLVFANCGAEPPPLADCIKPVYFVPEDKRIVDLLREFKAQKVHMAIVIDEFGGVRGLVTLEDVLEEIVGEIDDEYDKPEKRFRVLDDRSLLIHGKVDIEEVEEFFGVSLPEGPYESVGGLIMHRLGHVPKSGEGVEIEGFRFQVVSATQRHIKTVRIDKLE